MPDPEPWKNTKFGKDAKHRKAILEDAEVWAESLMREDDRKDAAAAAALAKDPEGAARKAAADKEARAARQRATRRRYGGPPRFRTRRRPHTNSSTGGVKNSLTGVESSSTRSSTRVEIST